MFTNQEILDIAKILDVNFDKFSFDDFKRGIIVELEHGFLNIKTNVTNNNLEKTAKIALAHLNEFPNYYNKDYGILKFEEFLKTKQKKV